MDDLAKHMSEHSSVDVDEGPEFDAERWHQSSSSSQQLYCKSCGQKRGEPCRSSSTDSDVYEHCLPVDGFKSACYVVWSNDTEKGVQLTHRGCWLDQISVESCRQNTCITSGENSGNGTKVYFCCCSSSNCNSRFSFEPPVVTSTPTPSVLAANSLEIILAATLTVFGLAVLIFLAYFFYRRFKMRDRARLEKEKSRLNMPLFSESSRPPIKYTIKHLIGRGRFGAVHQAEMEDGRLVAIKVFPEPDRDSWVQEQDIYSAPLMNSHDSILRFIAVDVSRSEPREYYLLTAYQENGCLHDYLKTHLVTFKEMLTIATSMLRGLVFLHEEKYCNDGRHKPIICHRDFKSRNVLLKKDLSACISDFGLAIKCGHGRTNRETHGQVGTRRYMAPEVLQGATEFSATAFKQIDVYAAALVLWELMSRSVVPNGSVSEHKLPYEDYVGLKPSLEDMYDVVVLKNVRPELKNEWHSDTRSSIICQTIQEMWDQDFEARLTAGGALQRFLSVEQPLNSVSFSSLSYNNDRFSQNESAPLICSDTTIASTAVNVV